MDKTTWRGMVAAIKGGHEAMLELGYVLKPQLHAFSDGRLLGYVQLRPVRVGEDAEAGIVHMGDFAAGARADEVIVAWETQDVAAACDRPARHEGPGLNLVRATAHERVLYSFTYREQVIGTTEEGRYALAPEWTSTGAGQTAPVLEPAMSGLIELSFQPWEIKADNLFQQAVAMLESEEYRIRLTV